MMELSKRLRAVAGMVTRGSIAADAGCDHAYTAIWLVRQGICPKAVAMDVRSGPLERAVEHIREAGLSDYIDTRISDGVEALCEGEADSLILAGMGGRLIERILTEGRGRVREMKEVILQPQSETGRVRRFLREQGFLISGEDMVLEEGKYYQIMRALPEAGILACGARADGCGYCLTEAAGGRAHAGCESDAKRKRLELYERYGRLLLEGRHPVLHSFLLWQREQYQAVLSQLTGREGESAVRRALEMNKDQAVLEEALRYFEGGSHAV